MRKGKKIHNSNRTMSKSVLCVCVRQYIHVCVTVQTIPFSFLAFSVTECSCDNHLFQAVIPTHRYFAFPTPTSDYQARAGGARGA